MRRVATQKRKWRMKVSSEEKSKAHKRIIDSAKELFKSKGIEKTSVAEVMNAAGMTHGGFYRHFDDKKTLIEVSIQSSFDDVCSSLEDGFQKKSPPAVVDQYSAFYLSRKHLNNPQLGCPIATLATEISKEGDVFKDVFSSGFEDLIKHLKEGSRGNEDSRESEAIRKIAMMAGAIIIARASNPKTAKKVLDACKHSFEDNANALANEVL
jgi:TetR/AcrR family transcriptional repressor of nem operon